MKLILATLLCFALCGAGLSASPARSKGYSKRAHSATWTGSAKSKPVKKAIKKMTDEIIIAATLFAEAGGEPWAGKIMVAEVMLNRAKGRTLRQVCLEPRQFSCWNDRRSMLRNIPAMQKTAAWADCLRLARTIMQPGYKVTSSATHYANLKLCSPQWVKGMVLVGAVGAHTFFREA